MITFNDEILGYFALTGDVLCGSCYVTISERDPRSVPVRIYRENIHPYKQDCHNCGVILYDGPVNVILFEKRKEKL